ncbi:MAG: alkaline phosphatase, DedA family [Candidatus Nomurabacteria bacterium]|nr:alkaline phosphatase, DedA family [Candidatus Nomurabacteria bacterium]
MPASLVHFIALYGYAAIFALIFFQEIGVPNPVSNELVLLFSGSLGFTGPLSFPLIFLTVVLADFLGAAVLYVFFKKFGAGILAKKHRWLPISEENINNLKKPIRKYGMWGVFLGRLLPFARGYSAVAAGLLEVAPQPFFTAVTASALVWSGGFVTLGMIFGSYISQIEHTTGGIEKILIGAILLTLFIIIGRSLYNKKHKK